MASDGYVFIIEWRNKYNKWVALEFEYTKGYAIQRKKELKTIDMKQSYRIKKYVAVEYFNEED